MELYIVRHGIAQPRGDESVTNDADRELTEKGRTRTRQAAQGLRLMRCRPGLIVTSPLVRAAQTAEIMAEVLRPASPVQVCDFLSPGARTADLVAWLCGLEQQEVMIVGHMPDVAEMASALIADRHDVDIVFKKAAVCHIAFEGEPAPAAGRLECLLQARHLRGIATDWKSGSDDMG